MAEHPPVVKTTSDASASAKPFWRQVNSDASAATAKSPWHNLSDASGCLRTSKRGGTSISLSQINTTFDEDVTRVKSKISVSRPQTHRLPAYVIWTITLSIAVVVAAVNYIIVVLEHFLNNTKYAWMQAGFLADGVALGAFILICISMFLAALAAALVTYLGPMCAGSGIPEAKGYLNGNAIPHMFTLQNLVVRIFGITLAGAAGYPIGREGPMVCIGGTVGYQVVDKLAIYWVRRWIDINLQNDDQEINAALIVDEERFAHAKRIGCALGGAAGIATAFNAPIGGILYMFEEVTVTSWPPELTFRTFVCTNVAATLARGFLNLTHDHVHHLVIFDDRAKTDDSISWNWKDVPFFVVLALFIGFFSSCFSRCMLATWTTRDQFKKSKLWRSQKKHIKALEAIAFAGFCALIFAVVPLLLGCVPQPHGLSTRNLRFVQHDCAKGEHREVASLLLSGAEEAVKQLFARDNRSDHHVGALLVACFSYVALACGMPGLPVPMGLFVPCLLIGALLGRTWGEIVQEIPWGLSHPGVYALVGSAAMLSGFTHMTLAIVVLLVEAAADLSLVSPIMMGIFVATLASKCVNHHAYDEVLILKKGVPFLEDEVPHEMDDDGTTAVDLCEFYPPEAVLPWQADASTVIKALDCQEKKYMDFPVVDGSRCIGLITRTRLEATVQALRRTSSARVSVSSVNSGGSFEESDMANKISERHLHEEDKKLGITSFVSNVARQRKTPTGTREQMAGEHDASDESRALQRTLVPVHRIMDRSPYTILEDMPAPRFYPLFIRAGVNAAAVVSKSGEFVGILRRPHLIAQSREAHLPRPQRRDSTDSGNKNRSLTDGIISESIAEKSKMVRQLNMEIAALKALDEGRNSHNETDKQDLDRATIQDDIDPRGNGPVDKGTFDPAHPIGKRTQEQGQGPLWLKPNWCCLLPG